MTRALLVAGCVSAALSVGAGAFGAHSLRASITPDMLDIFETACRYQMYHALALLMLAWASGQSEPGRHTLLRIAAGCFVAGTLLFSGSLYLYVLSGARWLVFLTPIGGVLFIAGWLSSAFLLKRKSSS